jgi:uncharacterized protein
MSLLLDLRRMREAHERIDRTISPSALAGPEEEPYTVASPVSLAFDIYKDGQQFHLVGTVKAELSLACGRCLETYAFPVDASFDVLYLPHAHNAGEGEVEVEEDDLTTAYYRDDEIDLAQLVREQVYLAIPMKPLCREECKGLCPECGTNRNTGSCDCVKTWTDPRLEGLKALLNKGDRGES